MDIIGDTDILGVWVDLLFSPLGLMLVATLVATMIFETLLGGSRRGRSRRWSGRSDRRQSGRRGSTTRARFEREAPPMLGAGLDSSLEEIKGLSPGGFEEFVGDLFHRRGYAVQVVGADGDHGVDLVVTNPDGERELVQCKRWRRKWIGEPVVRDFYGALMHDGIAVRGYIVTTSFFSHAARSWAEGKPLKLIDGEELAWASERIIEMGFAADKTHPVHTRNDV